MDQPIDYYQLLGLAEHVPAAEIKRAYRALARSYHPDRNPDDATATERFKRISEAYEVLSDPHRRRQYDVFRRSPFGPFGSPAAPSSGDTLGGVGDFFGRLVDEYRQALDETQQRPGADFDAHVRLTFEQALQGGKTEVSLPDGRSLQVTVPKGARDGLTIRLKGKGPNPFDGSPRGDLYVTFRVASDPRFQREGEHLRMTETVSALEALLGTTHSITNAYGQTIKLSVPPGTQPGERFRLRGQGVATCRRAGDLFVEIAVEVPKDLTDEQRDVLRAAAEQAGLL